METLRAFHGQAEIKEKYLARVRAHVAADELIHGRYWENGKGCAVGCTVHSGDHSAYERELGIPRVLARLEDGIFEGLPNGRSKEWPEQFLSSIEVGADLSSVWPRFAVWLLTDGKYGVIQFAKTDRSKKAIQDVSDAYQSILDGLAAAQQIDWMKLRAAAAAAAARRARTSAREVQANKLLELLAAERGSFGAASSAAPAELSL